MEVSSTSRVADFRDHLSSVLSNAALLQEVSAILTQFDWDISSLKADVRRLSVALEASQRDNEVLKTKYSEVIYKLSEVRQDLKK